MKDKITNIILASIEDLNKTLSDKVPLDKGTNIPLFGKEGTIDSIALVTLIMIIEENVQSHLNINIILASDGAFSQTKSPFLSIESLIDFTQKLVEQELNHV